VRAQEGVEQGEAVLAEAAAAYREALGERLVAAYALGSLAHGGFSPLVSDVDLGLLLSDPIDRSDDETIQRVVDAMRQRGSALHRRLSVFWGTASTLQGRSSGGRFPPLDRLDLLEHGRLLFGVDTRQDLARPGSGELLVVGAEFALDFLGGGRATPRTTSPGLGSMSPGDDNVTAEIRNPALLVSRGPRRLTKIVLFPVRFLFTAATGKVGTNELAVEHYLADKQAAAPELVRAALGWRHEPADNDEAATELLRRQLISLYLQYIDDHTVRLAAVGRSDLAAAFKRWHERLVT